MNMRINDLYRTDVFGTNGRRVGRVGDVLFDPKLPRVVGYVVERPRFLYMLDRKDRFLAADRASASRDEVVVRSNDAAWDKAAAARLRIDWATSVIWSKMPVRSEAGIALGTVRDVVVDAGTGSVTELELSAGTAVDAAVGVRSIPAAMVSGYRDGAVIVAEEAGKLDTSGGAAAIAGKTAVVAGEQARQAAAVAAKGIESAVRYGGAAVKVAAKSKTGKKAVGWLKAVKDELVDAMGAPDDDD